MNVGEGHLVACHECDALYVRHSIPAGARADCNRCGAELYRNIPQSLDKSLALYVTTFVLFLIANLFPFITMKTAGITEQSLVFSGGYALYEFGMTELGLVVLCTSIVFPFVAIVCMLYLLIPLKFGYVAAGNGFVYRIVRACEPWSLLSVFMLGTLIAVVKLQSLASVVPGIGFMAFVAMLISYSAARVNFDPEILWSRTQVRQPRAHEINSQTPVLTCHTCGLIRPYSEDLHHCERCGAGMHYRMPASLERTGALLISAAMMMIPANLYPVMTITKLGRGSPDTILSGIIHLMEAGLWGLGFIVLFASIVVPLAKISALSFLLYSVGNDSKWRPRDRTLLYRITEIVGAWSMVDIFLVGLLSGLVSLGLIATIEPGLGASFFACAVIFTMLAAHNFDPRLIWDGALKSNPEVIADNHQNMTQAGL